MSEPPYHITIVSHTHWDREWYQPFQVFRFQLVELIDRLLALLDDNPAYHQKKMDGLMVYSAEEAFRKIVDEKMLK